MNAGTIIGYFMWCAFVDLSTAAGSNQVLGRSDLQFKFGRWLDYTHVSLLSRVNTTARSLWLVNSSERRVILRKKYISINARNRTGWCREEMSVVETSGPKRKAWNMSCIVCIQRAINWDKEEYFRCNRNEGNDTAWRQFAVWKLKKCTKGLRFCPLYGEQV
jgi:hypothetical protein